MSRTPMSHVRRGLAALAAAVLGLTLLAPPATAALGDPPTRPGEGGGWNNGAAVRIKTYQTGDGACSLIASPSSIGGVCVRANAFSGVTIEQILGGDPLPECWDEALTEEELAAANLVNSQDAAWYWHRCLQGIDPETLEIGPDGIFLSVGIWPFEHADPDLVFLTENQQRFLDRFVDRGNVPQPVLMASPNPLPFVNDDISFYNFGDDEMRVNLSAPGVQMRARITEMLVHPEGRDGPTVTCPGPGKQADVDDTPDTLRDACWFAYEQSSLAQADDVFAAEIHVKWQVDARVNGRWERFHEFTKSGLAQIPVNEVQALVRP
jgi:hypothetical protein